MQQRIDFVDTAKAVGIFMVIYAHTMLLTSVQNWIYVFHMPLFFFISGYLFSFSRHKEFGGFAKRRFVGLVKPYVVINLITYVFWVLVARHVGSGHDGDVNIMVPLKAAVLVDGPNMLHDVPLWFLACLFLVEMIYYVAFRGKSSRSRWLLTAAFAVVGYLNSRFNPVTLPFSIGTALVALVFYSLGQESHNAGLKFDNAWIAVGCFAVTVVVAYLNGRINMHRNFYNNYLLFLLGGVCGTVMIMTSCVLIEPHLHRQCRRVIRFISDNTLYICGFHLLSFTFLKGFMVYVLHVSVDVMAEGVWLNLIFSAVSLASCSVAIYVCRRLVARFCAMRH